MENRQLMCLRYAADDIISRAGDRTDVRITCPVTPTNDKLILISYFLAPEPQGQQNTATIKNAENLVAAADIS